ncbi:MAG TPA: glycosyltransferase family 2 protein, partial [Verrucomicrobiae bacterium]|nr:glycosyltransferase family 2 protein [Verrucomicrobiae bacterium]
RSVFEKIGFFDVKVGLAGNEDDDFFRRARLAGFDLATTGRAYLHHFGSVTRKSINRERGRRSNAPLTDKQYYRRKHRLTWARRKAERLQEKLTFGFWRWNEKRRFGLTLKMARLDGQWYYS